MGNDLNGAAESIDVDVNAVMEEMAHTIAAQAMEIAKLRVALTQVQQQRQGE